eukprot:11414442-Ditylum_brightwellii.AAC.1
MHCCIEHKMQERLDTRIARTISGVNISTKKYQSSTSMASISSSKSLYKTYKTYKRNMDNQDKLPGVLFESAKHIQIFKHDFKVAMHRRSNWCQILKIKTSKGVKD